MCFCFQKNIAFCFVVFDCNLFCTVYVCILALLVQCDYFNLLVDMQAIITEYNILKKFKLS